MGGRIDDEDNFESYESVSVRLRTIVSQELAKSLDYIADKHLRGRGEEDWKTYHR
jgi:hypothetical protein